MTRQSELPSHVDPAPGRVKHWIGIAVGLFLGVAGILKLSAFAPFVQAYSEAHQPQWVFYGSGIIEILAGIAIMLPRTRTYAAWTLLAMIFLVTWKPWLVHNPFFLIAQIFAIGLLIVLVWQHRPVPSPHL